MNSRRPELALKPNFINQLASFENRLIRQGQGPRTRTWDEIGEDTEEVVLRNTYLNSQMGAVSNYHESESDGQREFKINFQSKMVETQRNSYKNPIENGCIVLKSALKGSTNRALAPLGNQQTRNTNPKKAKVDLPSKTQNSQSAIEYGIKSIDNQSSPGYSYEDNKQVTPIRKEVTRETFGNPRTSVENRDLVNSKKNLNSQTGKVQSNFMVKNKKVEEKSNTVKPKRPTTAPSKRPDSPKAGIRQTGNVIKGQSRLKAGIGPKISSYDILRKVNKY